jgi:hypothetical protein
MIEERIKNSNLDDICQPRSNDCEIVAASMSEVFDVDCVVCIYEPGETKRATHAAVKIDGELYDGMGKISKESLVDYLSWMKPKDFPDNVRNGEDMYNYIEENCIIEIPEDNFNTPPDKDIVERLK